MGRGSSLTVGLGLALATGCGNSVIIEGGGQVGSSGGGGGASTAGSGTSTSSGGASTSSGPSTAGSGTSTSSGGASTSSGPSTGSGASTGSGGEAPVDCGQLEAELDQALEAATFCLPSALFTCNPSVSVLDKCACPVVATPQYLFPENPAEAEAAYDDWVAAGCGPYDCDSCPPGPEDAPFLCDGDNNVCVPQ